MSASYRTVLSALTEARVAFVVVGAAAAVAHGAELSPGERERLDVVPDDDDANLRRLSGVLTDQLVATLRIEVDGQHSSARLDSHAFRVFPILPLLTSGGALNVVTQPAERSYQQLVGDAVLAELGGIEVRIASIDALLVGLPGSRLPGNPLVVSELRRLRAERRLLDLGFTEDEAATGLSSHQRRTLALAVQGVLARSSEPLAVRQILARLGGPGQVPYADVRRVADELTARGTLRRFRVSTSNRYGLNDEYDDRAAREIADVLRDAHDPQVVLNRALELLRTQEAPPNS